uniref:Uncharacterized protein n=1 Tax=Plectus sambesii TaxID=2011161 RepID=A0A914W4G5_9BILA
MDSKTMIVLSVLIVAALVGQSQAMPAGTSNLGFQERQMESAEESSGFDKRSNAELINGLIGMDLGTLSAVGKRSNAELINGLLGMNLNKLSSAGRK